MKKGLLGICCACGVILQFGWVSTNSAQAVVKERVYSFDDAGAIAGQLPIVIPGGSRRGTQDVQPSTTDYGGVDPPGNVNNSLVPLIGSANTVRLPVYAAAADRPGASAGNLGLAFDGIDDTLYAALPATPTVPYVYDPRDFGSQFDTLSQIWVKPATATPISQQFVYRIGNEHGGLIISTSGKWAFRTGTADDGYVESNISVQPNAWTHVAIYRGGNFSTLYVNGSIAARDPGFWGGEGPDLRLGSDLLAAADTFFHGMVDNFSIGSPSDGSFNAAIDIDYFADLGISFSGVMGDVNQDGIVNAADYDVWKMNVGFDNGFGVGDPTTHLKGDVNRSGVVDLYDFLIINNASIAMGNGALGLPVPEPTSLGLLLVGAVLVACRRARAGCVPPLVGGMIALFLSVNSAQAVLVVAEDFLYDGKSKALGIGGGFNGYEFYQGGQNGAGGLWTSRWGNLGDGIIVTPTYVPPGDPSVPEPNTPFLVGMLDGNSFGPNSMLIRDFSLAPTISSTQTLYFGGKFKADLTIDAVPNLFAPRLYINRVRGADVSSAGTPRDGSQDIAIGFQENMAVVRLGNDPNLGAANYGMETMAVVTGNPPDDGNWHFIIGKLEINVNGGANERLTAWIDPTGPETGGTMVQMERDILTDLSQLLGTFDAQATNLINPPDPEMGRTYIDDIAIGTTWHDVATVAIPRLTLRVNRANNTAKLINESSTTLNLSAYSIESAHGSLNPGGWTSLDDQLPGWQENVGTTSKLLESNFQDSTTLGPNGQLSLGSIFTANANEDLTGRYTTTDGLVNLLNVQFVTEAGLTGDYNGDGKVDAADYTKWRDNVGGTASVLQNRDPSNTGPVNAADYTFWKSKFGQSGSGSLSAGAVPEPNTAILVLVACLAFDRHSRARNSRS